MEGRRSVPSGWVTCLTRECDSRDLCSLCGICGSAYGSGEGGLDSDVTTNVWAGKCKLRFGTRPELWSDNVNAVLDGSDLWSEESRSALDPRNVLLDDLRGKS